MNRLLSAILTYPLVIVEAPSGYGKTTAVRDFLAKQEGDALWIPLQSLHDIRDAWVCFARELAKCDPVAEEKPAGLGFPANGSAQEKALFILNRLALARPQTAPRPGTEGRALRIEGLQLWLTGTMPAGADTASAAVAGTTGKGLRMEALEIETVKAS